MASRAPVSYQEHPWTFRLIGLNLLLFVASEISLAFDSNSLIYVYGLFDSVAIIQGQWWRLITSTLLHNDFVHLLFNMVAILIFGSTLEKISGSSLYLMVYFVGGVLANLFVLVILIGLDRPYLALGASGSIMAIIGASFSCALFLYITTKNPFWKQFFIRMAIIVGIQLTIDLMLPHNSLMIHATGVLSGALLGVLVVIVRVRAASSSQGSTR